MLIRQYSFCFKASQRLFGPSVRKIKHQIHNNPVVNALNKAADFVGNALFGQPNYAYMA
jgi:hypothetical protein